MGIEFSRSYKASNGKCYSTLKEAQVAELESILRTHVGELENVALEDVVEYIIQDAALVLNVLTTSENSRPKARAVNGGRKPRKSKATVTPQPDAQAAA